MSEKSVAVIFDSNILYKNLKSTEKLDCLDIKIYNDCVDIIEINDLQDVDLFLPEIVCLELLHNKNIKIVEHIKQYRKYSNELNTIMMFNFNYFNDFNVTEHINKIKDEVYKDINIIKLPDNKEYLFNEILDMSIVKKPPFDEGKSDKGMKDALIYLSLLEFAKNSKYQEFIFFTKDNAAFIKNKLLLESEFSTKTGKILNIENRKDVSFYISNKYKLFIKFKKYMREEFIDIFYKEINGIRGIINEFDNSYYRVKDIEILEENTEFTQINPSEFEIKYNLAATCLDQTDSELILDDIYYGMTFKLNQEKWEDCDKQINYKVVK